MPARVHALLVVRPDGHAPAARRLQRTLQALADLTRRVDVLTVVLCGPDEELTQLARASGAEGVITAPRTTRYAEAVRMATPRLDGDAVWLLAQDTVPEPEALERLAGALELAPSVAIAAPKLVRWDDRTEIVSLGVSMTRFGATIGLADGQFDQGQHDTTDDVLGSDVRGILVRADAWRALEGLDPALSGADEGLDLGVRARLAGGRVSVVPGARLGVYGDGVAGLPDARDGGRPPGAAYATRVAQLHRRLVYAPAPAVFFLWLAILPTAVWRTVQQLVAKSPGRILPEWGAAFVAVVRVGAVAQARSRIHRTRTVSWGQLAPLRISRSQLRNALRPDIDAADAAAGPVRGDLGFFSGGGAWIVLAALVVSVAAFPALLAWPVLGGGALEPLRSTLGQLWADAAYGLRATGLETVAPADPFASVVALLGSLWPGDPSRALVLLWILALPLAVLGGWFATTRLTDRPVLRITGAVAWALAPTFLAALTQGRPTGVLVHLLLPWLFYAGSVAHRSWVPAGMASLVMVAVVACAPSLVPALVALWLLALVLTLIIRRGVGAARVAWVIVPAVVFAVPTVLRQVHERNPWGLLADPGVPWAGPQVAADVTGRAALASGFPTADPGGWGNFLASLHLAAPTWWVPLLVAPVAVLALIAVLTPRWLVAVLLLAVTLLGLGTAFAAIGISVSSATGQAIALWPGAALSLAWIGAVGGAVVALDSDLLRAGARRHGGLVRGIASGVVMLALIGLSVPALTANLRGAALLTDGPASTLPAYVAAEGRGHPDTGTIALTPLASGGVAAVVVWGESETLGGQSTIRATRSRPTAADDRVAALAADLITSSSTDVVSRLASAGIGFVMLAPVDEEDDTARALRISAETALDQRSGLDAVGDTSKGTLWRVTEKVVPRAGESAETQALARGIAIAEIAVVAAALLLAVPTGASRRRARRLSRVVGRPAQEVT
ncbi:MAG: glycosyltransferase [Microbacterium sp.]|uniref:glycosyltransferase family 2 protein n=1 Tax=Microbacterium sp. TaxID=51671 RepID=UPI001ACA049A|nr:glycosyltransferase family 2 protein [Microbacterium sp.]MBN9154236.1 glycosyltransferase [Microbacterium sp.]